MTSGSETRQRQGRITIRLSETEFDRLKEESDRAGLSLSSYVRLALLQAKPARRARRPPFEKALLSRILGELGKIGSNINQIARGLNSGTLRMGLTFEDDVQRALGGLIEMRSAVLRGLGRKHE